MDEVVRTVDNGSFMSNTAQRDTAGYGCDIYCGLDIDSNGLINTSDLPLLNNYFFSSGLDGRGFVNAADLAVLKQMFFGPLGPIGLIP